MYGSRQPGNPTQNAEEPDELDALLDSYDQAAQADKQKVEAAQRVDKKRPTSMKDLRAEGMANPLTAANRSGRTGPCRELSLQNWASILLLSQPQAHAHCQTLHRHDLASDSIQTQLRMMQSCMADQSSMPIDLGSVRLQFCCGFH